MTTIAKTLTSLLFVFWSSTVIAQKEVHLYLHTGELPMIQDDTLFYYSISEADSFTIGTSPIQLLPTENLIITFHNRDSIAHQFSMLETTSPIIPPGEDVIWSIQNPGLGVYRIAESSSTSSFNYFGLTTYLYVSEQKHPAFFWELREHQISLNNAFQGNTELNFDQYEPEYYTVNDRSFNQTNTDSLAYVTGNVGDTINIIIVNNGIQKHAIHFHGYHATISFDSERTDRVGWEKETFPLKQEASMVLTLIPHQPGKYPVHDHALMAVNGKGEYLKGMIVFLDIIE